MKRETLDLILRITGWGLIGITVGFVIAKYLGIIHSPEILDLQTLLAVGVLIELGRIEIKVSLMWDEFRKKRIRR